jgi:tetratricopeptide (TPR) repeat protein
MDNSCPPDAQKIQELVQLFAKLNEQGNSIPLRTTCEQLYALAYESDNLEYQAEADYAQGVMCCYTTQHERGLSYFYEAEQKFELLGLKMGLVKTWCGIAIFYNNLKHTTKAFDLYKKALQVLEPLPPSRLLAQLYTNLTGVCVSLGADDLFLYYNNRAITVSESLGIPFGWALGFYNLGHFYSEKKQWDKTNEALQAAIVVAEKYNLAYILPLCFALLGEVAFGQQKPTTAIHFGLKTLEYQSITSDAKENLRVWRLLASAYEQTKDWEKAAHAQKQTIDAYKKMQGIETTNKINELNIQYESKKKEIEIQQAQLAQAQAELKALKSRMNPQFIHQTLAAIQNLIRYERPFEASDYLTEFSFFMRKVLDMSGRAWISLHEELEFLKLYLSLEKLKFGENLEYKLETSGVANKDFSVPALFLQPFVENLLQNLLLADTSEMLGLLFLPETDHLLIRISCKGITTLEKFGDPALAQRILLLNAEHPETIGYETTYPSNRNTSEGHILIRIRQKSRF